MGGLWLYCILLLLGLSGADSVASVKYWPKSTPMEFDIASPPHIMMPSRRMTVYHSEEANFNIQCEASGQNVTLKWYRNGEEIPPTSAYIQEHPQNGTLSFHKFSRREEGYFQCQASNQHGRSLSHHIEVRQRVTSGFDNDVKNARTYEVSEGGGIALPCFDRPLFSPRGSYSWYYKTESTQDQIPIRSNDRMDIDSNGTLYITMAERSDQGDNYACAVQSDELDNVVVATVPYISLKVGNNKATSIKPQVLGATRYITADKGGEVTLECFFSGNPKPSITWKDGEQDTTIINGTGRRIVMSPSAHHLTIRRLTDNDEGTYICVADNYMGQARATTFLNVTSRPLFEKESPQIIIAPTGSDATFSCVAKGAFGEHPPAPPYWTLNGSPIESAQDDKFSLSEGGTQLTVRDVTKNDVMSVQCNVTNSRGYAFGNGYLAVIEPLEIVSEPNRTLEVEVGRSRWLNMTVRTTSDPCCPAKFAWYLNDSELPKPSLSMPPYSYELKDNMATLSIRVDGAEEEVKGLMGRYRCKVFHEAYADSGKRNVTVDVKMKILEEPESGKVQAARPSYWWIGVVGGVIVLIIAIVLIVLMIRYNYPRQEYLLDKEEKKHKLNPEQDILDQSFEEI